jgi:8-oxo-dGTP pyrophosphatase MutT (NUDIX family)
MRPNTHPVALFGPHGGCKPVPTAMPFKQPRSVQVVLYAEEGDRRLYLLLKRVEEHGGFWQSVTGSLEGGETYRQAAVREVREETGLVCREGELLGLHLTNVFEIAPQWLFQYAPGVTHNEEVCFAVPVQRGEVRLDAREHVAFAWLGYEPALALFRWESNRKALRIAERLRQKIKP